MLKLIPSIVLMSVIFISCGNISDNNTKLIEGSYYGTWLETTFEYKFYENGTFWANTQGHYGNTTSSGKYQMIGDTLILQSIRTDSIDASRFRNIDEGKYLLDGLCIVDLDINVDFCTNYRHFEADEEGDKVIITDSSKKRDL